jgi:hypothetical protein
MNCVKNQVFLGEKRETSYWDFFIKLILLRSLIAAV